VVGSPCGSYSGGYLTFDLNVFDTARNLDEQLKERISKTKVSA
jgi:hypothetical protein